MASLREGMCSFLLSFFFKNIYLFYFYLFYFYIWLRQVLVEALGIFHCTAGFSLVVACGFFFSLVEARGLSSCGMRAYLPRGMWNLSSPTRDRTHVPCIGRRILYHWTTRQVPISSFLQPSTGGQGQDVSLNKGTLV